MNELQAISRFYYERLTASAELATAVSGRINDGVRPQMDRTLPPPPGAFPYVVWTHLSSTGLPAAGSDRRVLVSARYLVTVYDSGTSWKRADRLADLIDEALAGYGAEIELPGGVRYWVSDTQQVQPWRTVQEIGGTIILQGGGIRGAISHPLP